MKKKFNKKKILSITLLVLSIITLLYFIYAFSVSCGYLGSLIKQEKITLGKDFVQMIQYTVTNTFSYFFYGICFVFFAYIVNYLPDKQEKELNEVSE